MTDQIFAIKLHAADTVSEVFESFVRAACEDGCRLERAM